MPSNVTDNYSDEVGVRADLCAKIIETPRFLAKATAAGVKAADLQRVVDHGRAARAADGLQREQLSEATVARGSKKSATADVFGRERELAELMPLVTGDLVRAGETDLAKVVSLLSFRRYRVKSANAAPDGAQPSADVEAEAKTVERVERADVAARGNGLVAFVEALLRRPRVVALLAERQHPQAWLESLRDDAAAAARNGKNTPRPADATATEAREASAARAAWSEVRRVVTRRVVAGEPELEALHAAC